MMGVARHQLDHMQITCTSLQTDNHASISPLSFYRPVVVVVVVVVVAVAAVVVPGIESVSPACIISISCAVFEPGAAHMSSTC